VAEDVLSGQGDSVIVCWDYTETSHQNVIPDRYRTDVPLIVATVEIRHYCRHGYIWQEFYYLGLARVNVSRSVNCRGSDIRCVLDT